MRTLLRLFYVPYLQFLFKFHLIAIPVIVFIYVIKLETLMMLIPGVYPFALYATINRHQFKENIPWMLATFNKRTLITYHLVSQTLVTLLIGLLSTLGVIVTTIASITLFPRAAEKSTSAAQEILLREATQATSWVSTKEQIIIAIAAIFFLTTLYSPVALKDQLRQMEEGSQKWKKHQRWILGGTVLFGALPAMLGFDFNDIALPLLCLALVGQLFFVVAMYNRAFTLFHPRLYKRMALSSGVVALVLTVLVGELSLRRLHHSQVADQRVAEMAFLGVFAPTLSEKEFLALVKGVKEPVDALAVFKGKHEIPFAAKQDWFLGADEFGVALQVLKSMDGEGPSPLQHPKAWVHLDALYQKLVARNPAAARFNLSSLKSHLRDVAWRPSGEAHLASKPALEQALILDWHRKQSPQEYALWLQRSELRPQALDIHLDRAPASEQKP